MGQEIKNCKGCCKEPEYQEVATKWGNIRFVILCHKCQKSSLSVVSKGHVIDTWNLMHGIEET